MTWFIVTGSPAVALAEWTGFPNCHRGECKSPKCCQGEYSHIPVPPTKRDHSIYQLATHLCSCKACHNDRSNSPQSDTVRCCRWWMACGSDNTRAWQHWVPLAEPSISSLPPSPCSGRPHPSQEWVGDNRSYRAGPLLECNSTSGSRTGHLARHKTTGKAWGQSATITFIPKQCGLTIVMYLFVLSISILQYTSSECTSSWMLVLCVCQ